MAGRIFINYRRGDDPGSAQALFGRLEQAFSPDQLFMDVDNIEPGLDFVKVLKEQVAQCDVLIAVIGKSWIDARDGAGRRRLDNPGDFVRIEIESALAQDKRVIPVLVGDARLPLADELPEGLRPLATRHAVRLTHERFRADVQGLIIALQRALKSPDDGRMPAREAAAKQRAKDASTRERPARLSRRTVVIAAGVTLALLAISGTIVYTNYQPVRPPAIAVGKLMIEGPDEIAFTGEQGGPFSPTAIVLRLKAAGSGFHWSTVGAPPAWLRIAPEQGDLPDDGSAQVTVTLTPAAQSLAPARHETTVRLKNDSSAAIIASSVSIVVSPKRPPPVAGTPSAASGPVPLLAEQERALMPKGTFQECMNCPEMVVAPEGSFTMGSPPSEPHRESNEGPQHRVTFSRQFAAGKFAVTVDQFAAFVQETGHDTGPECYTYDGGNWGPRSGRSWRNPGFAQDGSHPAVCISWDDAKTYVEWLSRKTGKTYRLLSEAEREYVTRAGTVTTFWWGSTISASQANYNGVRKQTAPVESFQPNPWGLYQVHGNVWEWVEDCYNDSYVGAPTDGSAATAFDCSQRVHRGGSWYNGPSYLRSAGRYWRTTNYRDYLLGFRVARTLAP